MYVLEFFGPLAGRCGTLVVRERDWDTKDPGSLFGFDPGLRFSFFLIEALSITGQTFSKCLKNGSDSLQKGQLRRICERSHEVHCTTKGNISLIYQQNGNVI